MKKRIIALLLAVMFVLSSADTATALAESATNLKVKDQTMRTLHMAAGTELKVALDLTLKEGICAKPEFKITPAEGAPITFKDIRLEDAEHPENEYVFVSDTTPVRLIYTIVLDDYAQIGTYKYYITYEGDYWDDGEEHAQPGMLEMEVAVIAEKIPPQIAVISATEFSGKAGEEVKLTFTVRNEGEIKALNTYVSVEHNDNVMIPTYTPLNQKIGDMAKGSSKAVTVSYRILEDAQTQRVKLPVTVSYKAPDGTQLPAETYTLYLNVEGKEKPVEVPSTLLLNTVQQSPKSPKAGEKLTVTFNLENIGKTDITDVKVSTTGLSSQGFEPINSEPYQYIGTVKAGTSKKVEVVVKAGEKIPEGLNTLSVQYSYTDVTGATTTENVALNILNVQNPEDEEVTISRPKLMISNFYTDIEEVKAGNVFDFTFELLNTNDEIAAKNIKVTVTSGDGTFSVTAGGNSFFVKEIKPGETSPITINLKASAAATTKSCPINIKMEYEYEGMVTTNGYTGEVVNEELLLQVKENLRPSVENVYVGWGSPTVNQASPMNFEFYNMGKSMLNNTYVTIEGDFMLANGSNSYYIGNIAAGMPEYIEFDVIPLIEGNAVGKMIIHMEDSNGEEVTMEKEFTAYVMGEQSWEIPGPGTDFPTDPGFPTDTVPQEVAKPIVPLWIFLCIQGAILVIVIPVTRKIRLAVYRKKVKKEDEL